MDVNLAADPVSEVVRLMALRGMLLYDGGESVSQQAHALQCATLAEEAGATPAVIGAALLHDVAHLFEPGEVEALAAGVDRRHEEIGAQWLARYFSPALVEPVRLHVPAKRWLVTMEPGYWDDLSDVSKRSLEVQGGPFTRAQADEFAALPFAMDAIEVRRWDDLAKDPQRRTKPLDAFFPMLEASRIG